MTSNTPDSHEPPGRLEDLNVDWKRRVEALKGATYLNLDNAVDCLARGLIEDIGLNYGDIEIKRTILILIYENAPLLEILVHSLDIREL